MEGNIIKINPKKGFFAVDTNNGITVIELLDNCEIELNDIIVGELESLGNNNLYNKTKQENMDVYIQGINCSKDNAKLLMT